MYIYIYIHMSFCDLAAPPGRRAGAGGPVQLERGVQRLRRSLELLVIMSNNCI